MLEVIEKYENDNFIDEVLQSDCYAKFNISENTLELLDTKCNIIMDKQGLDWKPLLLEYNTGIKMYNKVFYYKK